MSDYEILRIRKHADRLADDPLPGESWPLRGVTIVGEAPQLTSISTAVVTRGVAEGWVEIEGESIVHRPGGPPEDPWRVTHTFRQAETIVLKCLDGEVRYRVTQQPDKYVDSDNPAEPVTDEHYAAGNTRVDWFYRLEKI